MNFQDLNLLFVIKLIPLLSCLVLVIIPSWKVNTLRNIALLSSLVTFLLSLGLYAYFDPCTADFQYGYTIETSPLGGLFNLTFGFGIDGLNLWLVLLSTFLTPICILVGWNIPAAYNQNGPAFLKTYALIFLSLEGLLIVAFSARDLMVFYLFFEAVLIPMFLLLGIFGSQPRNIRASYKMFLMTLSGSFPMLGGILILYFQCGCTDFDALCGCYLGSCRQIILMLLFALSFGVKTPLVPLHGWLPEAHTNAPTGGSIMLAGILLKLGTYGFLRWNLNLLPFACVYFSPHIYVLTLIGIIYVSLVTLRQVDIKKIIAYSSVAHMGVCILGLFCFNSVGLEGSLLLMIGHGVVSPGLFLCIGILYDRYKTRVVHYYGGLSLTMPLFSTGLLILTMANISLPLLSPTFAAELLIFSGVVCVNKTVALCACTSMVLTAAYALLLYARVCFGNLKTVYISKSCDLNRREFAALAPFVILSLVLGLVPSLVLDCCHTSLGHILLIYCQG